MVTAEERTIELSRRAALPHPQTRFAYTSRTENITGKIPQR